MRTFDETKHLISRDAAIWRPMRDELDNVLDGIRGKSLVCGIDVLKGKSVGVDLIEMTSGSAFPLHVHPGDHCLFVLDGTGLVTIGKKQYTVTSGDSIWIAAEQPHAVAAPTKACAFLAFGYPHRPVDAIDRMKLVEALDGGV